jgi:glyoxylase-like metal-dependent hydrolase (beta-lactamase superfamily II)
MEIRSKSAICLILAATGLSVIPAGLPVASQAPPAPKPIDVAPGIYLFQSPDHGFIGVEGNSYAIVNDDDVFVFDANQSPSVAQGIIEAIREITPKPVRYVANSHWHYDHWLGNEAYVKAFPSVEIIASDDARRIMQNVSTAYIRGLTGAMERANKQLHDELDRGTNAAGQPITPEKRNEILEKIGQQPAFVAELQSADLALPTLVYDHRLTLFRGAREFRVTKFVGNTPGDTTLYLPAEKILFTGDLLVAPIPYAFNSYPLRWIESLKELDHLDAQMILPGHGDPQHDKKYLELVLSSMEFIVGQVQRAAALGKSLEEIQKSVKIDAADQFTHGDAHRTAELQAYFIGPLIERAYKEATGEI